MSQSGENLSHDRVLKLMLIEDDAIFRLGLVTYLAQFPDLQILLTADSPLSALQQLQTWVQSASVSGVNATTNQVSDLDLVVLSLNLGQFQSRPTGLSLCQQLRNEYPTLPILLLGSNSDPVQLAAAFQAGAKGYCSKSANGDELVTAIRQAAAGQSLWISGMLEISQRLLAARTIAADQQLRQVVQSPFANLRRGWHQSGLQQIDQAIDAIDDQLHYPNLTWLDQVFLTGRRRELRAARSFVNWLLKPASGSDPQIASQEPFTPLPSNSEPYASAIQLSSVPLASRSDHQARDFRTIQAALFDTTAAKLQSGLHNFSNTPLEIDILREEKKRELLYITLRKLEEILDDLRFSQVQFDQLAGKEAAILQDLWRAVTIEFVGKYYTIQINQFTVEIVNVLLQDVEIVQTAILNKIPLVQEFLAHLLFQIPLLIDESFYAVGTVEAMARMEILLQNLMIQVANAVMQPMLNRFNNVLEIKQNFYDKRLLSTREIERFRNNLSWKYRIARVINEPKAIFESQYLLFILQEPGIAKTAVYSPRTQELDQLSGVQLVVTLALETRDAIAPRLQTAVSFIGSGVVYVLTEIIGRGIGLIGRGIVKGIGNALQDRKIGQNSERWR